MKTFAEYQMDIRACGKKPFHRMDFFERLRLIQRNDYIEIFNRHHVYRVKLYNRIAALELYISFACIQWGVHDKCFDGILFASFRLVYATYAAFESCYYSE